MPHETALPIATLYLDETGTSDGGPVTGLGGWIAYDRRWRHFSRSWKSVLRKAGVDVFHMVDFAHGNRAFRGWSEPKRLAVIRRLCAIAESHTFAGIARAVESTAYDELVRQAPSSLELPKNAYVFCFQCCLEQLVTMCGPLPPGAIDIVLEQGGGAEGPTRQRFEVLKANRPAWAVFAKVRFAPKSLPPLQAADLLIYETQKYIREKLADTGRDLRKSLGRLIERRKVSAKMLDRLSLEAMIDDLTSGHPSPTRPPTFRWLVEADGGHAHESSDAKGS